MYSLVGAKSILNSECANIYIEIVHAPNTKISLFIQAHLRLKFMNDFDVCKNTDYYNGPIPPRQKQSCSLSHFISSHTNWCALSFRSDQPVMLPCKHDDMPLLLQRMWWNSFAICELWWTDWTGRFNIARGDQSSCERICKRIAQLRWKNWKMASVFEMAIKIWLVLRFC